MSAGRKLRLAGDYAKAATLFSQARVLAVQFKQPLAEARAELAASACEIRLFRYRSALASLSAAEHAAQIAGDRDLLGASAGNISVIYSQLGDYVAAEAANLRAVEYLRGSLRRDYLALALINLGEAEFGLNRIARGKQSFYEAIDLAKKFGLRRQEASARDDLGIWLLLKGQLSEAEPLLQTAYEIRNSIKDAEGLPASLEHLAELRERMGGVWLSLALANINEVLQSRTTFKNADPVFYSLHLRGRIYLKLHKTQKALRDFRQAVKEAEAWRQDALPGDAIRTRTSARLAEVYEDCIQLLAALSIKTGNRWLAREGLQLSLHQQNTSLGDQQTYALQAKLLDSEEYRSLLQQLQAAQAMVTLAGRGPGQNDARQSLSLIRARVRDFQYRFGADLASSTSALQGAYTVSKLQANLAPDTALLSFALGSPVTYVWAVTQTRLDLYALPTKHVLAQQAFAFRAAINHNGTAGLPAGALLSKSLFGQLPQAVLKKKDWLISAEGELLDLMPWSALPDLDHVNQYLVHMHSIRIVTGFRFSDKEDRNVGPDRFLGIGDPVYNHADPRYRNRVDARGTAAKPKGDVLARLVGSQKEVETSARILSLRDTKLLLGNHARVQDLVESTRSKDAQVIHFAVHVISPEGHPGEAALALSIGDGPFPELLTNETVSTLRIPGALVVLSGCASQQGDIVPGAGIVGLGRSWLLAGAEAVVVSAWPTPDDSGAFFRIFYEQFRTTTGSLAQRAAQALRNTQLSSIGIGRRHSSTSFWAAYSVIARR